MEVLNSFQVKVESWLPKTQYPVLKFPSMLKLKTETFCIRHLYNVLNSLIWLIYSLKTAWWAKLIYQIDCGYHG